MKKIVMILAMVAVTMGSSAQLFDFSSNSGRFSIGFHAGQAGLGTDYSDLGFGFSASVMGFYLDFVDVTPEHRYDNHVTNTLYNDSAVFIINAGYQIPVLPWLRVTPMVGYCQTNHGVTDATTVNIETDEYSSQMYHDYDVNERFHYFNYGVGLSVQPLRWFDIYAVYSRNAIYGGISINLSAFRNE